MRAALSSVIVPTWNARALTVASLERLARHTTAPCELIVVDNGSRDGTPAWLERFAKRPGRLRRVVVLRNRSNRGYPQAMNQGLAQARGHWLVFGNADAAVCEGWLEGLQAAFRARPRVGGVSPCSNPVNGHDPRRPWAWRPLYAGLKGLDRLAAAAALSRAPAFIAAEGFVPGFCFLTTRPVLDRVGGFDERFSPGGFEDWDLQWRLRRRGLRLGFAGRVHVHHAWSGVSRANGVDPERAYGAARLARFHAKHPRAAKLGFATRAALAPAA